MELAVCGYRVCGGDEGASGPGRANPPLPPQGGRKTVPGTIPGSARADGGETSGSENETHLVAAGTGQHRGPGEGGRCRLGVARQRGTEEVAVYGKAAAL